MPIVWPAAVAPLRKLVKLAHLNGRVRATAALAFARAKPSAPRAAVDGGTERNESEVGPGDDYRGPGQPPPRRLAPRVVDTAFTDAIGVPLRTFSARVTPKAFCIAATVPLSLMVRRSGFGVSFSTVSPNSLAKARTSSIAAGSAPCSGLTGHASDGLGPTAWY